jgi:hypothetical protein
MNFFAAMINFALPVDPDTARISVRCCSQCVKLAGASH